jgi:hypothetical protein
MKVDGRCYCGFLAYSAEVDPERVEVCHCTDCQTLSGSPFRWIVPAEPGTFRLLAGEPATYVKTAESGNRRIQAFCPKCGTSIYSGPEGETPPGKFLGLRVGALAQRSQLLPKAQYWIRSRQRWVNEIAALTAFEKE